MFFFLSTGTVIRSRWVDFFCLWEMFNGNFFFGLLLARAWVKKRERRKIMKAVDEKCGGPAWNWSIEPKLSKCWRGADVDVLASARRQQKNSSSLILRLSFTCPIIFFLILKPVFNSSYCSNLAIWSGQNFFWAIFFFCIIQWYKVVKN